MDTVHERSQWRRKCVPCFLFLLTILRQTEVRAEPANGTGGQCANDEYLNKDGICCNKCSPGHKLTEECPSHGLRSTCVKCGDGTYLDSTNYFRNCFRCTECKKHSFVQSNCTHERNTVCSCKPGYYKRVTGNTVLCEPCKTCRDGERVRRECTSDNNTICECEPTHYRVKAKLCAPCQQCNEKCKFLCSEAMHHPTQDPILPKVLIPILGATTILSIVSFVAYVGIRRWRKKNQTQLSPESPDGDMKKPISCVADELSTADKEDRSVLLSEHCDLEQVLPDCVPREIKTHEFIYFALDVLPVKRFKELVRHLNVSEQDIDRAERDNHAFADAQYQMLKVWSDNGTGGGKNILPRPLLQEFVVILKDMNLNGCAETIESKFCSDA